MTKSKKPTIAPPPPADEHDEAWLRVPLSSEETQAVAEADADEGSPATLEGAPDDNANIVAGTAPLKDDAGDFEASEPTIEDVGTLLQASLDLLSEKQHSDFTGQRHRAMQLIQEARMLLG